MVSLIKRGTCRWLEEPWGYRWGGQKDSPWQRVGMWEHFTMDDEWALKG